MKILHLTPGADVPWNGIARMAAKIAAAQGADLADLSVCRVRARFDPCAYDEVWVHGNWLPAVWRACFRTFRSRGADGPLLVRMPHGNLDPVRYGYRHWKKAAVAPIERFLYARTDRIVVTCAAEADWVRAFLGRNTPPIDLLDAKRFFSLSGPSPSTVMECHSPVRVLYLGRRHPLKGLEYLERAVEGLDLELHIVSNATGPDLEREWEWCDLLCLPTLSENFGLVIAEALERGKRVITTDGAPAWDKSAKPQGSAPSSVASSTEDWRRRLVYLRGFRDGDDAQRIRLLRAAFRSLPSC